MIKWLKFEFCKFMYLFQTIELSKCKKKNIKRLMSAAAESKLSLVTHQMIS